ncbi:ribonuclease HII [Halobacteriales archaeon Cl-PHB]
MLAGVDEAGKGPVLGSMFAAAVRVDPAALPSDVGDSKDIPPERRQRLETEIREVADAVAVAEVPVDRIDDPETDMNRLTVAAHAEALAGVCADGDGLEVVVDAGDTDADRFGRRVADRFEGAVDLTASHGADAEYAIVGAASIVAKEAREAHVEALAAEYGAVGSGYPSDPTTRKFLRDYVEREGELPACARSSWQTCADVLAAADQSSLADF